MLRKEQNQLNSHKSTKSQREYADTESPLYVCDFNTRKAHQPTKWNMFIILKLKRFKGRKLLLAHTQILGKLTNDFFSSSFGSWNWELQLPASTFLHQHT